MSRFNIVEVDGVPGIDGRLPVINPPPVVPVGSVLVEQPAVPVVVLAGLSLDTQVYTITLGKVLTLQRLNAGSEGAGKESAVTLYFAPAGVLDGTESLLSRLYVMQTNEQIDFSDVFTGDNIAAIILERQRLDGGTREVFARWIGYET